MHRATSTIALHLYLPLLLAGADFAALGRPGPHEVETRLGEWIDTARHNRGVPFKAYLPKATARAAPVVVFSPGGGGSRDDESGYLGLHLASHGFASFHLQHRGSDADALRKLGPPALLKAIRESRPSLAVLRQQDIPFAVDQIERLARHSLRGRIDPQRIGMEGFSFGAVTTLIAAGQRSPAAGQSLAEPRFRAAFALSPSPRHAIAAPVLDRRVANDAYAAMLMPLFHLTGTNDATPATGTTAAHRRLPFELIHNVDQYLLVLDNAVHPTFGGKAVDYPEIDRHRELIKLAAVVFWRAYLNDDPDALAWLQDGGYETIVGAAGRFEFKPAAKK